MGAVQEPDFEKLGVFYLGRQYDAAAGSSAGMPLLLYDSRDLVTHAVCVGMTGSGKTGLCTALIEEAAIDGVPVLVVDPKGDMANLLLSFPALEPEDFLPWIEEEEAARQGLSPLEFATLQAAGWREGLASFGQDGERIRRMREAADFAVYTPGSTAGRPLSILSSMAAPPPALAADKEFLADRVGTVVESLLGLVGVAADPLKSREHILLSALVSTAWTSGRDLDLPQLIGQVQTPPFERVGVLDVESFYPARDRFELVLRLNNLLAAPGFDVWLSGEPLDIDRLLFTKEGRPRVSVFTISHLGDGERMFFVSLLLNEVLGWVRSQQGSGSLRALLYIDEILGYMPPVAAPPSKRPLLALLKQARAFGLGVVLATQNPVDLDYKGLGNAGTWFIGRLQTERDRSRLLEGLGGTELLAGIEGDAGPASTDELIAGLKKRVFLMRNVHDPAPALFESRWALSYLRGPLTRAQIKWLTVGSAEAESGGTAPGEEPRSAGTGLADTAAAEGAGAGVSPSGSGAAPTLDPGVPVAYLPLGVAPQQGEQLVYEPQVLGMAGIRFVDVRREVDVARDYAFLAQVTSGPIALDWGAAERLGFGLEDLDSGLESVAGRVSGDGSVSYVAVPPAAADPKSYAAWQRDLQAWLYHHETLDLYRSPHFKLTSAADEDERDFLIRVQHTARERRDEEVAALEKRYAAKLERLEARLRKARQTVEREAGQARDHKVQTAVSVGATLLSALVGRKAVSTGTVGRATTAARGVSRSARAEEDVKRARETVEQLERTRVEFGAELEAELEGLKERFDSESGGIETVPVRPKKANILVRFVGLVWVPVLLDERGYARRAFVAGGVSLPVPRLDAAPSAPTRSG